MFRNLAQIFSLVFVFTIPWENAFTIGSLGSVSRIVGLVTAGLWVISILFKRQLRKFSFLLICIFVFLLFNIASIFWTVDFDLTFARVKTYLQMAIQVWMLWDLLTTEKMQRAALLAFLIGAFIAIGSTIYNFLSGQLISQWEYGRYTGGGQNAGELALILSFSFPVALYLSTSQFLVHQKKFIRILLLSFIPSAFIAIILTASRTALFAVIPGLFYIFSVIRGSRPIYRFLGLFILLLTIFAGQSFIPQATLERLGTVGDSISSGDLGGRMALWKQSIQIFLDHPLLGIGSGSLVAPDQLGAFAHNTFLSILTELGLLGFLIFIGLIIITIIQAFRQPKLSAYLWLTILASWLIGVQSLTWEYTKTTWFVFSMVAISASVIDRKEVLITDHPIPDQSWLKKALI
jgi:O-antigen ligase